MVLRRSGNSLYKLGKLCQDLCKFSWNLGKILLVYGLGGELSEVVTDFSGSRALAEKEMDDGCVMRVDLLCLRTML